MEIYDFTVKTVLGRCLQHIGKLGEDPHEEDYRICIEEIRYQLTFLGDWIDCTISMEAKK